MAKFDVAAFLSPVSEDACCGPDLAHEGDADYMNFMARVEGLLPQSFFTFDRSKIDFPVETKVIEALLERTRDLRLVVIHAKLSILNRDLDAYVDDLEIVAAALETLWQDVHPRDEGHKQELRVASVLALDDQPDSLMPLQFTPLIENRRVGSISWRTRQIAAGLIPPRANEAVLDIGAIDRAFLEVDLPVLVAQRDRFIALKAAADRIDAASLEHGGFENRINLEKLKALAVEVAAHLDGQIGRRDPSAASTPAEPEGAPTTDFAGGEGVPTPVERVGATPALSNRRAALAALAAAGDYFRDCEPSSPTLLLIRFARKIANRSLNDVIRIMMPDMASRAAIPVVPAMFRVTLDRLTETADYGGDLGGAASEDDGSEGDGHPVPTNRRDALRLLDLVSTFFRTAEPASPLPVILTRARDLAERDFQTLLKELFTDSALQSLRGDDWR